MRPSGPSTPPRYLYAVVAVVAVVLERIVLTSCENGSISSTCHWQDAIMHPSLPVTLRATSSPASRLPIMVAVCVNGSILSTDVAHCGMP